MNQQTGVLSKVDEEARRVQQNLIKAKEAKNMLEDFFKGVGTGETKKGKVTKEEKGRTEDDDYYYYYDEEDEEAEPVQNFKKDLLYKIQ